MKVILLLCFVFGLTQAQVVPEILAERTYRVADANGDGHVTRGEFELFFYRYDSDGDNRVTENEFVSGTYNWADDYTLTADEAAALFFQQDVYPRGVSRVGDKFIDSSDIRDMFTAADTAENGVVGYVEWLVYFSNVYGAESFGRMHARFDFDRDLRWIASEFNGFFFWLDVDGDGVVSQVEFLARLVPEYSDDLTATYLFGSLDSDGDGVLSEVDIDEMYADIDKDKDGILTLREWSLLYQRLPVLS